ncbi:MAG: hypothetical protein U0525_04120 [Patescibacteria group bacterium]
MKSIRKYSPQNISKPILLFLFTLFLVFYSSSSTFAQVQDWDTGDPTTSCVVDGVPTLKCLEVVYSNILYLASAFVLLILFGMIVWGAFTYLTSMGNSSNIQKGSNILKWAFIGLGIYVASYVILFIIDVAFLGGKGEIFRLKIPGPND